MERHYKDEINILYDTIKVAKDRLTKIASLSKTITEQESDALDIANDGLGEALYELENIIGNEREF